MSTRPTYSVDELCAAIADAVSSTFSEELWVQGSISGLTRSANGHVYFDLVDPTDTPGRQSQAVLPVVLFSSQRQLVNRVLTRGGGIRMHDGIEIRIRGQVSYYPPQGRIQLVMSLIDPDFTLGRMAQARQQLLDALRADDLLEANRGLTLTPLPLRVALITSDQSAAYHDFVTEITSSPYPFTITVFDARVQGPEAGAGLAEAVGAANRLDRDTIDVIVVARGGGARSDLAAFDDEALARAIAASSVPVVTGIGHEVDRSVADEVAHTSTKTPTAAARFLVDQVADFDRVTAEAALRLATVGVDALDRAVAELLVAGTRLASAAKRACEHNRRLIDHRTQRMVSATKRVEERSTAALDLAQARLNALDPANALRRGWTITHNAEGILIRSVDQVAAGTVLSTRTADGSIRSIVVNPDEPH